MYLNNFSSKNDLVQSFQISNETLKGAKIKLAWYGYGDYCGSAFVLFERDGKLYEVHGSHCSCDGIEGQWDPQETTVEALEHFVNQGSYGSYDGEDVFKTKLKGVLKRLKNKK